MSTKVKEFDDLMRRIFGPCRKISTCEREFHHAGKCRSKAIRKVAA